MKPTEVVHARIDALTEGLSTAVRKTDGAQFALMLSMISESRALVQRLSSEPEEAVAAGQIESRDELYTAELVGGLSQALHDGRQGDLQLMLSWLDTVPLEGRQKPLLGTEVADDGQVSFSQAAVMARQYNMLDEIRDSRVSFAA